MKRIVIALAASAAFAAVAIAAPETVVMEAKNGNVTFSHKTHAAVDCATCHVGQATPAKLNLGKDAAHKLCIDCHKASSGPARCNECHKR